MKNNPPLYLLHCARCGLVLPKPPQNAVASPPAATVTPTATASGSPSDLADRIHQKRRKSFAVTTESRLIQTIRMKMPIFERCATSIAIPTWRSYFCQYLGACAVVIMIGMFTLLVSRMRQRTIRMMVEKVSRFRQNCLRQPRERCVGGPTCGVELLAMWPRCDDLFGAVNDWEGGAMVSGANSISDRPRLSPGMEIGRQKQRSSSSAGTVISRLWS